jgi:hypothetical protein
VVRAVRVCTRHHCPILLRQLLPVEPNRKGKAMKHPEQHTGHSSSSKPYLMLAANLLVSAIIMYFVMFTMIDGLPEFFHNLNMFYMALMMVAPMAILMLLMMGSMYRNKKLNLVISIGFAVLFIAAFGAMREQTAIGDRQFLRSMIPHHSGAILMCREAVLRDSEIRALCDGIIRSQRQEIAQMKRLLGRD